MPRRPSKPREPEHRELFLRDIAIDPELQVRLKTHEDTMSTYRKAYQQGQEFPPLLVAEAGSGYVLLDGFHRFGGALGAGLVKLPCKVIFADRTQWPWLAAEANLRHGLPLNRLERRETFKRYVRAGMHRKGSLGLRRAK